MAKKLVKSLACDRCPIGKEKPATRSEIISIGTSRWRLDLCEECGNRLDRDLYAWGRLGTPLEEEHTTRFTEDYVSRSRRAAELRYKQREEPDVSVEYLEKVQGIGLPHSARDWTFTSHAQERMEERGISAAEALRAACLPEVTRLGRTADVRIHETATVQVAVNPASKSILTVARQSREDKQ